MSTEEMEVQLDNEEDNPIDRHNFPAISASATVLSFILTLNKTLLIIIFLYRIIELSIGEYDALNTV